MEWIRVEDWLPLVSKNDDGRSDTVLMTVEDVHGNHLVECGYYNYMFGGAWCYFFDDCNPEMFGEKVLAWAPMPEPYTKESWEAHERWKQRHPVDEKYYIARWFIDGNDIPFDSVEYNEQEKRYIFHFNKHAFKECDLWAADKLKEVFPYPLKPNYPKSLEEYGRCL